MWLTHYFLKIICSLLLGFNATVINIDINYDINETDHLPSTVIDKLLFRREIGCFNVINYREVFCVFLI